METKERRLDVRLEAPAHRHEAALGFFTGLKPGEIFELVNDRDLKAIHCRFATEHAGEFSWASAERGPVTWRALIGRTVAIATE